jgi:hypothetical protein
MMRGIHRTERDLTTMAGIESGSPPTPHRGGGWAIVEDGVLAGVAGACVVAVWFLLVDSVRATPFFTPNLLAHVVFTDTSVEAVAGISLTMVFAYTGLHLVLFLVAGLLAAAMFSVFEDNPQFGMVLLLLTLLFLSVLTGLEIAMMPALVGVLGTWAVTIANLLAAVAVFAFLCRRRPHAIPRLRAGHVD